MPTLINRRYKLAFENRHIRLCEAWTAEDLNADGNLVQLFIVRRGKASELVHTVIMRRADSLQQVSFPHMLPLLDFGFDGSHNLYYFAYAYPAGTRLDKFISDAKPSMSWSIPCLTQLVALLENLHNRSIAHGSIRANEVYVANGGQGDLYVNLTGLTDIVRLLLSEEGSSDRSDFDQALVQDIKDLGLIAGALFCRKPEPSPADLDTISGQLPSGLQQLLKAASSSDLLLPEQLSLNLVRRVLERMYRELGAEKRFYLSLTDTAISRLHENGYIQQPRDYLSFTFLTTEFQRGVYAWSLEGREPGTRSYRLSTSQVRLLCVPSANSGPSTHLKVVTVHAAEPAELAADQERGLKISAHLVVGPLNQVPSAASISPLVDDVDRHVELYLKNQRKEEEHKGHLEKWEALLNQQQQLLREFALSYVDLKEIDGGSAVELRLGDPPDELDLSADDLLRLTGENGQQRAAGYFEGIVGDALKLGLAAGVDADSFKKAGVITIDNAQVEAVLRRQKDAFRRLRYLETVNPHLPLILAEPAAISIDNPTFVDIWFQGNLDESQQKAVRRSLAARDLFLIQGPPGTGKTSVIAELVLQIIDRDETARILISSQSNVAVNHALGKVIELRPSLAGHVVRVGREEKAGTTEALLLDRQLHAWRQGVLERCEAYQSELQDKAFSDKALAEALAVLSECERRTDQIAEQYRLLETSDRDLVPVEADFTRLENALSNAATMRQEAEALLQKLAPGDDRFRQLVHTFEDQYLAWAKEFLQRASETVQLSYQRSELLERISQQRTEIARLEAETEAGKERVNEFLKSRFKAEFVSLKEQSDFLDTKLEAEREKAALVGRIQRLVSEWRQRVGQDYQGLSLTYLRRCKVVGATCIGVAAKREVYDLDYDWVIVDEAGRATHPELLVPLVRGRRIILVGDHRQLPPTFDENLSAAMTRSGYSRTDLETSLFQEIWDEANSEVKEQLDMQYRMHPAIGKLISDCFYDKRLRTGVSPADRAHGLRSIKRPVIWYSTRKLPNNVEARAGSSRMNEAEIDVILRLLHQFESGYAELTRYGVQVGIITGYAAQKAALWQRITALGSGLQHLDVEVDTVDAYQGRERDIIIYSIVRSNPKGQIGFLRDDRRLNVALSRACQLLVIVGNDEIGVADVKGQNPFHVVLNHIRQFPADCALEELLP